MFRFLTHILKLSFILLCAAAISIAVIYLALAPQLPDTKTLKQVQMQVPLRIFSSEGKLIAEFGEKRRIPIEYKDIPKTMIHAILAAEDARFFEHPGVDYQGILRAAYSLITTGKKSQGGSTITMQVARNFFLSRKKTYLRKLNEIILSLQMERVLTKEEILTLYLNKIYLGNRAYGVAAAAQVYYGKPLQALTLPQYAMIAGLPKAPSAFNPLANPQRAKLRRNYVLRRMMEVGYLRQQDYDAAIQAPITARYHSRKVEVYAPYIAEIVRTKLVKQYGEDVYNLGLDVFTTVRAKHQKAANQALQSALLAYDKRHGYRGAVKKIPVSTEMTAEDLEQRLADIDTIGPLHPALVVRLDDSQAHIYIKSQGFFILPLKTVLWARKQLDVNHKGPAVKKITDVFSLGDQIYVYKDKAQHWQLGQIPEVEGALIAVSPFNGAVTALNGGFEYFQNKFNRVTQSRRQPGSGFKPFLYSAALEKGYTAATIINDAPVVIDDPEIDDAWRPENYSGKFFGPTRLRVALTHSRNLVSIRILRDIGIDYVIDYATRFGFDPKQLPHSLSLALGSGSASPWTMARAYSAFANGGYRIEPYIIQRIENASGETLFQANPVTVCETCLLEQDETTNPNKTINPAKRIITPQNNYIMNSLLRDVIRYGTGRKAMTLGRHDLAGKTGTTNDQVDAWFNGFHPELVAISWVGFDTPRSLGRYETGSRAALPMWIDFMRNALKDVPEVPLQQPVGMVTVKIDPKTGLLAGPYSKQSINEVFREDHVPTQISNPPPEDLTPPSTDNTDQTESSVSEELF